MPDEPDTHLLGPLSGPGGRDSVAARVAAIVERRQADRARAEAMLAARNPPRTFDTLLSGQVTGPAQGELFANLPSPKARQAKPAKKRHKPDMTGTVEYAAARAREQEALQLRRRGMAVKDIAKMVGTTPRTVRRYLKMWRGKGEIAPGKPGRPPSSSAVLT